MLCKAPTMPTERLNISGGTLALALALAFAYGATKAAAVGRRQEHLSDFLGTSPLTELSEEVQFRALGERVVGRRLLGLSPGKARFAQAVAFGLIHPGNEVEAALGGLAYSMVYEKHGLLGSFAAHLFHNLGVWAGSS